MREGGKQSEDTSSCTTSVKFSVGKGCGERHQETCYACLYNDSWVGKSLLIYYLNNNDNNN